MTTKKPAERQTMFLRPPKVVFVNLVVACLLGYFYSTSVVASFMDLDIKARKIRKEYRFSLPRAEMCFLKVWGGENPGETRLNGDEIQYTFQRKRTKSKIFEFYYKLPRQTVRTGTNVLTFENDELFSILIKNNLSYSKFGVIGIKNKTGANPVLWTPLLLAMSIAFAGITLFEILLRKIATRAFSATFNDYFWLYLTSYLPLMAFLGFVTLLSRLSPIQLLFFPKSFAGTALLLFILFFLPRLFVRTICSIRVILNQKGASQSALEVLLGHRRDYRLIRLWLNMAAADKGFMIAGALLMTAAIFFSLGAYAIADIIANIIFFLLVVSFLKKFVLQKPPHDFSG